jgi:hypothetical protein
MIVQIESDNLLIEQSLSETWGEREPRIGDTIAVTVVYAITAIGETSTRVDHPRGDNARHFTPAGEFVNITPIRATA